MRYKTTPGAQPIAKIVMRALEESDPGAKAELFGHMTEREFIAFRVDTYFAALEQGIAKGLSLEMAERSATERSLHGLNVNWK